MFAKILGGRSRKSKKQTSQQLKDVETEAKLSAILLLMYYKHLQPISASALFDAMNAATEWKDRQ